MSPLGYLRVQETLESRSRIGQFVRTLLRTLTKSSIEIVCMLANTEMASLLFLIQGNGNLFFENLRDGDGIYELEDIL